MDNSLDGLNLRPANINDLSLIVNLHNSNFLREKENYKEQGFLLERINIQDIKKEISDPEKKYYVLINKSNNILGYVSLANNIDNSIISYVEWEGNFDKKLIYSKKHKYLAVLVIDKNYTGLGLAQYIYKQLFEKYPGSIFTAFIATNPFKNRKSLDFHYKQGFIIGGRFRKDNFCGLKNYKSLFLYKKT